LATEAQRAPSKTELLIAALSFRAPEIALARLAGLSPDEWAGLLPWTDRKRLTLQLFSRLEPYPLAAEVREAFETRREKNRRRLALLRNEASKVLATLQAAGLRASILKGFTLAPSFVPNLELRQQYDLDLYLTRDDALRAHQLLQSRGSYALDLDNEERANHLPALIPKSGWEWRGDFFDLEIPIAVELHFRLWNPEFECIALTYPEPHESQAGQLASIVLHLMRHIFHGNVTASHVYELSYFLEHHFDDMEFWREWREWRVSDPVLQDLSTAAFAIAARVFGARLPELPISKPVAAWVRRFGPTVLAQDRAGKSQLLLQLTFLRSWKDRFRMLRRRLLPLNMPPAVDGVYLTPEQLTFARRVKQARRQVGFVAGRVWYHAHSLFGFLRAWALWRWGL